MLCLREGLYREGILSRDGHKFQFSGGREKGRERFSWPTPGAHRLGGSIDTKGRKPVNRCFYVNPVFQSQPSSLHRVMD